MVFVFGLIYLFLHSTGHPTEIIVTWSTFNDTESQVQFGVTAAKSTSSGSSTKFVDGGPEKHTQFIHRVKLTKLKPGTKYGKLKQIYVI